MRSSIRIIAVLSLACSVDAATLYVALDGGNVAPYSSWADAATNLQYALSAASNGDSIVIADGAYVISTSIMITGAYVSITSVNGPENSAIYLADQTYTNTRLLYVLSGSTEMRTRIQGLTIASANYINSTFGGAVYNQKISNHFLAAVFSNCVFRDNRLGRSGLNGTGGGGAAYGGIYYNCKFLRNSAAIGATSRGGALSTGVAVSCRFVGNSGVAGGACFGCDLKDCYFESNTVYHASGGAYGHAAMMGTVSNCVFIRNGAAGMNGAVAYGTVFNSLFINNQALQGGAVYNCTVYNSVFVSNSASKGQGGVAMGSGLINCLAYRNSALTNTASVSILGTNINCTFCLNSARNGMNGPVVTVNSINKNCIIYDNTGGNPTVAPGGTTVYSCVDIPMMLGDGCTTNYPSLSADFRLLPSSPCVDSGLNEAWMLNSYDLSGNPRIVGGTVDMGCYEWQTPGLSRSGIAFRAWLINSGVGR